MAVTLIGSNAVTHCWVTVLTVDNNMNISSFKRISEMHTMHRDMTKTRECWRKEFKQCLNQQFCKSSTLLRWIVFLIETSFDWEKNNIIGYTDWLAHNVWNWSKCLKIVSNVLLARFLLCGYTFSLLMNLLPTTHMISSCLLGTATRLLNLFCGLVMQGIIPQHHSSAHTLC